jgi:hypothetical protein
VLNTDVTNYISQRVKILSIKKEKHFGSLSNFKTIEVNIADTFFVYVYRLYNTIIMDWLFSLLGVSWERSMFFSHRARHCFSRKANICIQVYSHFLHTKSVIFLQIFSKISCWILSIARQIILGFFPTKFGELKFPLFLVQICNIYCRMWIVVECSVSITLCYVTLSIHTKTRYKGSTISLLVGGGGYVFFRRARIFCQSKQK